MKGRLHLVGVGPGDPELVTLKAVRILSEVGVVAFPQKQGESSLAHEIARVYLNADAELMPVEIPMTTEREPARKAYNCIAKDILRHLDDGADVAYLCEGDPLFYGSAMYLIERVGQRADVAIIPGVSSLTAAAAAIGRPLAARNEVLKVLPAPLSDAELKPELETAEAVAIIKVGRHFPRIRALLQECGYLDNAMIIEHATTEHQRITPLSHFKLDDRPYFSTILCYLGGEEWGGNKVPAS